LKTAGNIFLLSGFIGREIERAGKTLISGNRTSSPSATAGLRDLPEPGSFGHEKIRS
jgi:hypothetical protein